MDIEIFPQYASYDIRFGFFISDFDIDGTYQSFQCITEHGFGEAGLVIIGQKQIEPHFIGDFVERVSLDNFGSHFGKKPFVAVRVFFEEIFSDDSTQYCVAEKLESLIVCDGIIARSESAFVKKSQFEQREMHGYETDELFQPSGQILVWMEVIIVELTKKSHKIKR